VTTAPEALEIEAIGRSRAETIRLYVDIARPKVMGLVLFTGLPALLLGQPSFPDPVKATWVLIGTALAGTSCSALNAWWERESDARMARTRKRPLPASVVLPRAVLAYGLALAVVSTLLLWAVGGALAAAVGLSTIVFYVGVYTMYLKPRTPQNIVIGGAAGGTAPLIASAAMNGEITVGAWVLFTIIFLWTPPHFWAIALFRKREYANAGFPMMPNVIGDQPTRWRSLFYTVLLVAVTLLPVWLGDLGAIYAVSAVALGAWFTGHVVRSIVADDVAVDWKVFKASVAYLFFLFLTMIFDLLMLPWGTP
jgi:protoheme IX farnesyltransferase